MIIGVKCTEAVYDRIVCEWIKRSFFSIPVNSEIQVCRHSILEPNLCMLPVWYMIPKCFWETCKVRVCFWWRMQFLLLPLHIKLHERRVKFLGDWKQKVVDVSTDDNRYTRKLLDRRWFTNLSPHTNLHKMNWAQDQCRHPSRSYKGRRLESLCQWSCMSHCTPTLEHGRWSEILITAIWEMIIRISLEILTSFKGWPLKWSK